MSDKPDEAARFIKNATAKKKRAERKASPTIKASAEKALMQAAMAGAQNWPLATEEDVRKLLTLTKQEIAMLAAITSGKPPRNAQSILAGIRLKLEYSMKKPKEEEGDRSKPVHVTVNMLSSAPVEAPPPAVEAAQDKETIQ
jgi:hypothetical protein